MKVIITGVLGQDGKLLSALLRDEGHDVLGVERPRPGGKCGPASGNVAIDLCDRSSVDTLIEGFQPDQIYHLAACHHSSELQGDAVLDREMVRINFLAVETMLGALLRSSPQCRLLLAGSSQMYSRIQGKRTVIDEGAAMAPSTFYGHTKAWARELVGHYRQRHGVFGCTAILFNHESPARPTEFLSRKVTRAAARAAAAQPVELQVRDPEIAVDWSSAKDVVKGMSLMLAAIEPADCVLASGTERKVSELLETAFRYVGLEWQAYTRTECPASVGHAGILVGDPRRAENVLGWRRQVSFEQLIREMVNHDRVELAREHLEV